MNTATRVYSSAVMRDRQSSGALLVFSRETLVIVLLSLSIFLTAISVVYAKDLNRRLFIQYQSAQAEQQQDDVDFGKLLLEQTTWSQQARIQSVATDQLGMIMPLAQDAIMVKVS